MRIAILAPIAWRTPPRQYGPWEMVTSLLTEALVKRGVDVTLFATQDSITAARMDSVVPAPYNDDPAIDAKVWEYRHLAHMFAKADQFDIIHNQADFPAHAFADLVDTPVITTIHGFSSDRILPMYRPFQDRVHFVAISDADRHPDLRYAATIHHGIAIEDFPFDEHGGDDLLFFGRIHPDKGAAEAIALAKAINQRLNLYGPMQDRDYFNKCIEPELVENEIQYHGVVGGHDRLKALKKARALLHLINFDEPFGLSVVEAMACGTPVIANKRGSMSEIIEHGITGFLVESREQALAATKAVHTIARTTVRNAVKARFSVEIMADNYINLYEKILANR